MTRFTPLNHFRRPRHADRAGFTLIELLVVMALIATLAALAMLVAPGIMDKDRARDAATQLQGALQNARARALRDGLPRGVRLIVDTTSVPNLLVTSSSYQYVEVPPVFVPNTLGPAGSAFVQLTYNLQTAGANPPPGTIMATGKQQARTCMIGGLTPTQLSQIQLAVNSSTAASPITLALPTLGTWATITPGSFVPIPANPTPTSGTIQLFVYPDAQLGGETNWATFHFGLFFPPRPLLGEATMQMPVNTCVDLSDGTTTPFYSQPPVNGVVGVNDYDVLFAPSGQLMNPSGVGQVFLWVRDPNKGTPTKNFPGSPPYSMNPGELGGYPGGLYTTALNKGGEQLLVTIKATSGGTGVSPVFWPVAPGSSPYDIATRAANSP